LVRAASSPAARWTFDAGSGNTVADSVGTANGTRAGGASWITSAAAVGSGAMHFDGVDGRVEVPNTASLEPSVLSLTAWVRGSAASPPSAGQVIVEKGDFSCGGSSYGLYVASGGILISYRTRSGEQVSGILTEASAKTQLWDGAWHLIGATITFSSYQSSAFLAIDGSPFSLPIVTGNGPSDETGATL
jgi:hypothetical protein